MKGQRQAPATIYPGKDPVSVVQEARWVPGPIWTGAENLALTGIRPWAVQPVARSLYRLSYPAHYLTCGKAMKGKVHPITGHEGPERELMYSSTLSLTSALDWVGGHRQAPAALYSRERPGSHCIGGWVGPRAGLDGRKVSFPTGFDTGPSSL